MYFILIEWCVVGSAEPDQYIGPFLSEDGANEWGHQVIGEPESLPWSVLGEPESLPWSVLELTSPTSAVKQFQVENSGQIDK